MKQMKHLQAAVLQVDPGKKVSQLHKLSTRITAAQILLIIVRNQGRWEHPQQILRLSQSMCFRCLGNSSFLEDAVQDWRPRLVLPSKPREVQSLAAWRMHLAWAFNPDQLGRAMVLWGYYSRKDFTLDSSSKWLINCVRDGVWRRNWLMLSWDGALWTKENALR